ncbi:bacillithiol biosynthesis cysteine-adding enzyme BshC [Pedobacter yulinensis]|uniref:Putative cysteine ligase BshC n=1 Tax=Pedobacter yulinensis TaxID=2126353 RepID=A0A2T3HJ08_9SPHI|nr:bacillithiol biosynthesis cysteine-adding enzyme BshC [Pedobacter yulinensis]PST82371.1 bacillithiol biosynthesis cysteine-adding enzyme BshC [Pedobacter yulinensis]
MQATYIPYSQTNAFSPLVLDYLAGEPALKAFYGERPDLAGLGKTFQNRQFGGNRDVLVKILKKQYAGLKIHQAVGNNIDLLLREETFTVTTGHQLNLFTGPLYFIYKIVTAINLALELKIAYPDKNFVPVYWMATEDHDFAEINHVQVEEELISWIQQGNGATGRLSTDTVTAAVTAYKGYLGLSENGKKLGSLVEAAYLGNGNLADATRQLVNSLFEKYGLVIINADEHDLKTLFSGIMAEDIVHRHSAANIAGSSSALEHAGYPAQVHGREINFFYLHDNLRERILFADGLYTVNKTEIQFTASELLAEIETHPERFSPNVVMRPLYQEVILPNIAYIGGGAEIAYWMQLKANFDFYKIDFPVLVLRNSALLIDPRSKQNLFRLGISTSDIFQSEADLVRDWVLNNSRNQLFLADESREIQAVFDRIKLQAYKIDKSLPESADAAKTKTLHLLHNLEKKLLRAEKRNHDISLQQIRNVKARLFPGASLQERVFNLAPMYVNYGEDFLSTLIERFQPLEHQFTILTP